MRTLESNASGKQLMTTSENGHKVSQQATSDEAGQQQDGQLELRPARIDQRRSDEHNNKSLSRSRSRGRTPSELLARKQQMLMSGNQQGAAATNGLGRGGSADPPTANQMANQSALESAESKLKSLSVLLKSHQSAQQGDLELLGGGGGGGELSPGAKSVGPTTTAAGQSLKSIDDVYILLAKKEKDLQLAAELGKVLLERNDELSKANERIAEEYSHKLELLEQEKHKLKRKLDQLDGEYENRLIELQTDCNILKNKLEQQQQLGRQAEKEKSKLIDDLVQQNQRLTGELAEATKSEELLSNQLEQVNERLQSRSSTRSDHVAQVEALQDELQVLNRRKQDLERRLKLAHNEKVNLLAVMDETGDKVLLLENLLNEKDLKIGELAIEIGELRDSSSWLSSKLESMISLNERLLSDDGDGDQGDAGSELRAMSERERSHLVEQLKDLRLKRNSRIKANEMILQSAAERQRRSLATSARLASDTLVGGRRSQLRARPRRGRRKSSTMNRKNDDDQDGDYDYDDYSSGQEEEGDQGIVISGDLISEVFNILTELHGQLLQRKERLAQASNGGGAATASAGAGSPPSQHQHHQHSALDDSGIGSSSSGADELGDSSASGELPPPQMPAESVARWRQLVEALRQLIEELPCASCHLMIAERADYEQLQRLHARTCDEIRLKNDELLKFNAENIEQRTRLSAAEERVELLQGDLSACDKPKEEIVRLAWKARDEAVARKNNAEIQLAKTRIENMQVSSQLMEVVQQKGELSQKLAQFEDDIHYMMQRSVRARFSWEEYAEETRRLGRSASQQDSSAASAAASGIQQLISLSSAVLLSPSKRAAAAAANSQAASQPKQITANGSQGESLHEALQAGQQPSAAVAAGQSNLLSNFKSARFNLRFWQRANSSQQDQTVE